MTEIDKLKTKIAIFRRALLKCAYKTQYRDVYDVAIEALGIKDADDLIRRARKEGIR